MVHNLLQFVLTPQTFTHLSLIYTSSCLLTLISVFSFCSSTFNWMRCILVVNWNDFDNNFICTIYEKEEIFDKYFYLFLKSDKIYWKKEGKEIILKLFMKVLYIIVIKPRAKQEVKHSKKQQVINKINVYHISGQTAKNALKRISSKCWSRRVKENLSRWMWLTFFL